MASSRRASVAFAAFLLATYLVLPASPYSMGAPQGACKDGVPQHGVPPQNGPSPYRISVSADAVESSPGQYISVRLAAGEEPFIGFLLQARNVTTGEMAGKFLKENPSDDHLLLACDNLADAVTHSHKREKREVSLRWEAPPGSSGDVTFSSTFVRGKDKFWVGVESPKVRIERAVSAEVETPTEAPTQTPPAREGGRNPSLGLPPGLDLSKTPAPEVKKSPSKSGLSDLKDHAVYEGCGKSKGCFGEPDNCLETKDCQMFVTYALSSNAESYHFEIQGFVNVSRNDGYIAVGISSDPFMGNDAVVACVTHESRVKPLRGFNIPNDKSNRMTTEQQTGLSNFQGSLRDTTLYCSFDIEPEFYATADNISSPFHLAKNEYYLLLASGPVRDADHIDYHVAGTARTRKATALAANLVEAADDMLFVRLHGSFMFGAWIGSASLGMMFARYFKTTWSNSQLCKKDIWFRFHQLFMIVTWGLTMAGFVLIFLALGGWSFTKNPHPILGCVTTGLCFLQPIGALFRPAPDSKRRPIFNWLHWFGGNAAQIVGIVAMFFAVDLQRARLPEFTWWILVAFVAFHGLVHFILSIVQCVSENRGRENRADVYPMKDMGVGQSYYYPQTKQDAAGGGLRKFLLAIYFIVNAAFTAVLVLMVVFAPIEKTLEKWNLHNIF